MHDLPPLAWVAICAIAVIIIVMNLALVGLFRFRSSLKMKARPSRSAESWQKMGDMIHVIRDPFGEERKQLTELSRLVQRLDEEKKADPDSQG